MNFLSLNIIQVWCNSSRSWSWHTRETRFGYWISSWQ